VAAARPAPAPAANGAAKAPGKDGDEDWWTE
jgi:hypothetical protein